MYPVPPEFIETIAGPLGWFYLIACAMNVGAAGLAARR